jgi:surface antigen
MDLLDFVQEYLGVANTGDNAPNAGQCVGLIEVWLDKNLKPHVWGNAVDLMANAPLTSYKVTPNGPTNFPAAGNILCWGSSWGGGDGHCAVVLAANAAQVVVFEQNDPDGSPPIVATHDYSGVAGWIGW